MIQATGLSELRDNVRVYYPQSFNLPPAPRTTVKVRFSGGRLATARVVAVTDGGDTIELVVDGRDWFLHKDRENDWWLVA